MEEILQQAEVLKNETIEIVMSAFCSYAGKTELDLTELGAGISYNW